MPPADAKPFPRLLERLHQRLLDSGIDARLHPASSEAPVDQVLLALSDDADLIGAVTLLPGIEPPILQVFVEFPVALPRNRVNQVARLIALINAQLPVHGFELAEDAERPLRFRHLAPLTGRSWDLQRVTDMLGLVLSLLGLFVPLVIGVAEAEIDFKEARRRFARMQTR